MKHLLIVAAFFAAQSAQAGDLGLNASSLKLKVYKFAVSTSPLCTNLQTIVDNGATPSSVEFVGGNGLGAGTIANGTYPCVVIEMDNIVTFTPSTTSTSGSCQIGVASTLNVCDNGTSTLIDGSTATCSGASTKVALHLSTASSGNSNPWVAPTTIPDASNGFNLGTALTISGSATGKFVVNPSGQVCDYFAAGCDGSAGGVSHTCHLQPPSFTFTQQ